MKKNRKLVIVGDSDLAQIAYEYFTYDSSYQVCAFAVEKEFKKRDKLFELPVVQFEEVEQYFDINTHEAFVAITYPNLNRLRTRLYLAAKAKGYKIARYISSKSFCWHNVILGENVFIFEDNTLQPFTKIGNNVILWSGNHIGHHSEIKDNCFISSHVVISGHCVIDENCFIGVNSTISNGITIAKDNFINLGAVVLKSTEENAFYEGNPAMKRSISSKKLFKVSDDN
ncbi:UDP-N-acetylbacillosamine N-acetyltransferase [Candidatus Arcanobacter lacustris]|uniref:UDP-N-acetylbacillosamine N-acetyltransferase n=1 Tax=Candidatus Arcanibacter lacustris TaxID=1607817 RepID=A0A0F5MPB3_9RICK|nr:UDP-N-acetylbacillosamine N-acetyltransferase [Candidatus Arcanobacter lacustris]KKB96625.1 UDP-N-acetylbacillosamine N-acetyltransferase [Candidatus Arcanobacter lacustris]